MQIVDHEDVQADDAEVVAASGSEARRPLRERLRWWILFLIGVSYLRFSMESRPQWAGSLLIHVVLLIVLCAAFHILFIDVFPFNEKDWKKVDYVWLGFTALGLVGVTGEARRVEARLEANQALYQASSRYDELKNGVRSDSAYYCQRQWRPAPGQVARGVYRDYLSTCDWLRQVLTALPGTAVSDPSVNPGLSQLFDGPPAVQDRMAKSDVDEALQLGRGYIKERGRHSQAVYTQQDEDPWEVAFKFTGGFLLVFALALRITKVTGELLLE